MHRNGHGLAPVVSVEEFTRDIAGRHTTTGPRYRRALWIFGVLSLLGVVGFTVRAVTDGFDDRLPWGYLAATMAFLLTTGGSAPLIVIALRMSKAHWRRPLARISEMYSVVTIPMLLMFIPLLFLVPSALNRRTLWFQGDTLGTLGKIPGAPHFYDTLILVLLAASSIGLLWVSSRPDRAVLRGLAQRQAGAADERAPTGWRGTRKQWKVLSVGLGVLGAFYFMTLIGAHTLVSVDFAMALVPGWRDAIFPAFHSLVGLQAGLATVVLTMFLLRRYGGLERYIHMEHFWGASKILLAFCLLWFYFWWSGFIIFWYGRMPDEQNILQLFAFGPYQVVFVLAFLFSFVAPFLTLLWNGIRKTTWGPALASAFILFGALMERIRIYVPAYSLDDIYGHAMEAVPPTHYPDVFDIMMVVGGISAGIFAFLLAARIVPMLSVWEMTEGLRLRVIRPFLRTETVVQAKPE